MCVPEDRVERTASRLIDSTTVLRPLHVVRHASLPLAERLVLDLDHQLFSVRLEHGKVRANLRKIVATLRRFQFRPCVTLLYATEVFEKEVRADRSASDQHVMARMPLDCRRRRQTGTAWIGGQDD